MGKKTGFLESKLRIGLSLLILLLLAGAVWQLFSKLTEKQEARIATLEEAAQSLKESWVPLRFQVTRRETDSFRVKVKLYDLDDEAVGEKSWTLPGGEFFIDFMTVPAGDDLYVSFPQAVFTDTLPPSKGKDLYSLYNRDGSPGIYEGGDLPPEVQNALDGVFQTLLRGERAAETDFGNVIHDIQRVRAFREGYVYRVVCRRKGGIEVVEE